MSAAGFFTDEDVYGVIGTALRRARFDAVSTPETGRLGESDVSQLQGVLPANHRETTQNAACDLADRYPS
jgi:hypothetical protein